MNRVLCLATYGFAAVLAAQLWSGRVAPMPAVAAQEQPPAAAAGQEEQYEEWPGAEVTARVCNSCHGPENYEFYQNSRRDWTAIVDDMIGRGASGTPAEFEQVVSYLTAELGRPLPINEASAAALQAAMGLTPSQAQAIIDYRTKNGPFKSIDDVLKVPDIPADRVKEQRRNFVFEAAPAAPAAPAT